MAHEVTPGGGGGGGREEEHVEISLLAPIQNGCLCYSCKLHVMMLLSIRYKILVFKKSNLFVSSRW